MDQLKEIYCKVGIINKQQYKPKTIIKSHQQLQIKARILRVPNICFFFAGLKIFHEVNTVGQISFLQQQLSSVLMTTVKFVFFSLLLLTKFFKNFIPKQFLSLGIFLSKSLLNYSGLQFKQFLAIMARMTDFSTLLVSDAYFLKTFKLFETIFLSLSLESANYQLFSASASLLETQFSQISFFYESASIFSCYCAFSSQRNFKLYPLKSYIIGQIWTGRGSQSRGQSRWQQKNEKQFSQRLWTCFYILIIFLQRISMEFLEKKFLFRFLNFSSNLFQNADCIQINQRNFLEAI